MRKPRVRYMRDSKLKWMTGALLTALGAAMIWFSLAGCIAHFKLSIAIPLAVVVSGLLAWCFVNFENSKFAGKLLWGSFSVVMVLIAGGIHGLSTNTHLSHEGGDRAKIAAAESHYSASESDYQEALLEKESLDREIVSLVAEIAAMQVSRPDHDSPLAKEIAQLEAERARWNGLTPAKQRRLNELRENFAAGTVDETSLVSAEAMLTEKRRASTEAAAELAAFRSAKKDDQIAALKTSRSQKLITATVMGFANGNELLSQQMIAGLGMLVGSFLELVYGCLWMRWSRMFRHSEVTVSAVVPPDKPTDDDSGENEEQPGQISAAHAYRFEAPKNITPENNFVNRTPEPIEVEETEPEPEPEIEPDWSVPKEREVTLDLNTPKRMLAFWRDLNRGHCLDRYYRDRERPSVPEQYEQVKAYLETRGLVGLTA